MSAIQLSFTLRTSTNVKTCHLLGSWDNYSGQLPLSKDSSRSGGWKGTFRFQGATLAPGQRYWYYVCLKTTPLSPQTSKLICLSPQYIMDGYHVSHNPAMPSTTEPTTGRSLNILDVPSSHSSSTSGIARPELSIQKRGVRTTPTVATGRSLSPSKIAHPKPSKPYASRGLREADYSRSPDMDDLTSHLEKASLYHRGNYSPASSIGSGSDLSSRGSGGSSPSSLSSLSDPSSGSECRCNRWGITRKGDRVKLDCGGSRCGYSDDSDSSVCSSEAEESEEEEVPVRRPKYQEIAPRRQPVAVAAGRRRR